MSIDLEFSKFAHEYERYNIIQEQVADELIGLLDFRPRNILDLGCGSGALAKRITWPVERFVGVDFAERMLQRHPKSASTECFLGDFDDPALYQKLLRYRFDCVLSSSALQWAKDLDFVFAQVARFKTAFCFAVFTSGTFETVHKEAGIDSPLRSADEVLTLVKKHLQCKHHLRNYRLSFQDNYEMFRYIKRSGVSGNRKILSYKDTKSLIENYPLDYLEFEVLFLYG